MRVSSRSNDGPGVRGEGSVPIATRQGPERSYWVHFDEPQQDGDGDGPYVSSQVLERYLEPAPE